MPSFWERNSSLVRAFAAGILSLALINAAGFRLTPRVYPSLEHIRVAPADAMRTAGLLTLGMRRLAADISFIDLLTYYGTPEPGHSEEGSLGGGGHYPEIEGRASRLLDLDPYFTFAALYSAGSLAFNLDRPDQAIEILRRAEAYQPKLWKFRAYEIAIGLKRSGNAEGVVSELTPMLQEPDCPNQLRNMLAFLNRKLGHRAQAIAIYRELAASGDPNYVDMARHSLRQMGAPVD